MTCNYQNVADAKIKVTIIFYNKALKPNSGEYILIYNTIEPWMNMVIFHK